MSLSPTVVESGLRRKTSTVAHRELIVVLDRKVAATASALGFSTATSPFLSKLTAFLGASNAAIRPLFGGAERRLTTLPPSARPTSASGTPNLSKFFKVSAEDQELDQIALNLRKLEEVRAAYIKPLTALASFNAMVPRAVVPPAKTPDLTGRQEYLDASPGGVDARYAWTIPGGTGKNVRIVDVEGEWRFTHEDLLQNKGGVVGGVPPNDLDWRNHGTAVIGVFGADNNRIGVTGICPDAEVSAISIFPTDSMGSSVAIRLAAERLRPGDIILIELHRPGPRHGFLDRDDQLGYIPIEWWPDDFDIIRFATQKGIVVVEAGGNGAENLDDPLYDTPQVGFPKDWTNPLKRSNGDSGAILVGAGAPPPKTHGKDHGPDRSRLDFSNYGSMIDVQGWGREVTTCGYGDLQGGANEDAWYTDEFSGTSSASPVIVGVIGCLQGILRNRGARALTSSQARQLLRTTGSAQTAAPGRPQTQRIGNRPDLRQLIATSSKPPAKASTTKLSKKKVAPKRKTGQTRPKSRKK